MIEVNVSEPIQEDFQGNESPVASKPPLFVVDARRPVRVPSEMTLTVADFVNETLVVHETVETKSIERKSSKSAKLTIADISQRCMLPTRPSVPKKTKTQLSTDETHWLNQYKQQEIEYAALYLHSEHLIKELQETTKLLEQESHAAKELEDEFLNMELDLREACMIRDRLEREKFSLQNTLALRDADYANIERELHELRLAVKLSELDQGRADPMVEYEGQDGQMSTQSRSSMSHVVPSVASSKTISPSSNRRLSLQMSQRSSEPKLVTSGNLHDGLLESLRTFSAEKAAPSHGQGTTFLPPLHPKRRPSAMM